MDQREHRQVVNLVCFQTVEYNFQKSPSQMFPSHLTMLGSTFANFEGMAAMSRATSDVQPLNWDIDYIQQQQQRHTPLCHFYALHMHIMFQLWFSVRSIMFICPMEWIRKGLNNHLKSE